MDESFIMTSVVPNPYMYLTTFMETICYGKTSINFAALAPFLRNLFIFNTPIVYKKEDQKKNVAPADKKAPVSNAAAATTMSLLSEATRFPAGAKWADLQDTEDDEDEDAEDAAPAAPEEEEDEDDEQKLLEKSKQLIKQHVACGVAWRNVTSHNEDRPLPFKFYADTTEMDGGECYRKQQCLYSHQAPMCPGFLSKKPFF
jgi:hypothetical protein